MKKIEKQSQKNMNFLQSSNQAGFFRLYAFFIIAVLTIGYTAYYFGTSSVMKPVAIKSELQNYYSQNEDGYYRYGADDGYDSPNPIHTATPYADSPANYTGSYSSAYEPMGYIDEVRRAESRQNEVPSQNSNQDQVAKNPDSQTNTQVQVAKNQTTQKPAKTQRETQPATMEGDRFISKINPRVSFLAPKNTEVTEGGDEKNISFKVSGENGQSYQIYYSEASNGCFDPVNSFAIRKNENVDFRIIHSQKEEATQSTYRALQSYEEYGTYAGQVGFRGNACVFTSTPTKIEIRSAGFTRQNMDEGFRVISQMIYSFRV